MNAHAGAVIVGALDRRTRVSLALAVAAHVVAFVSVRPRESHTREESREPAEVPIELLVDGPREEVSPAPVVPLAPQAVALAAPVLPRLPRESSKHPNVATTVPEAAVGSPPSPSPPASGEIATSKPIIPPLLDLDSPGKHGFILPPASSATVTKEQEVAAKLDASIKSTLDAKAQVVDGGYGGPVVSAAHVAASSIVAPQVGYATFDIETDSKGVVTTVKLVDYGGDLGWHRVQKELQANLESQRLKVPTGAEGVHVRVKVEAEMRYPSGATKKIQPNGLGFGFDVSDIGAEKRRVVAVKLISQNRL